MPLTPGTRLGAYEILSSLGAGGMGEVYRARDTTLNRDVAIKVLPGSMGGDADRIARLRREAQVLASLNHPNIAHIYGLEGLDGREGTAAIVMELVEGPTLAEIIGGALPVDTALRIARQIVEALDAAHELGIVHRDLKPANIKVRDDGTVKVLDFGLAKAVDVGRSFSPAHTGGPEGPPVNNPSMSPTLTSAALGMQMTSPGMILGTPAYMSPEQARAKPVDKRTDIWAFGCVLFEMLTGGAPFEAPTSSDVIAAVLTRDPDWTRLPETTPAGVRRLLRRCLDKDPRQRLRDIADAREELGGTTAGDDISLARATTSAPARSRSLWSIGAAAAIGGAIALAIGAAVMHWQPPDAPAAHAVRLSLGSPGQFFTEPPSAVISPDGSTIVFVAADASGKDVLWLRALDSQDARAMPGTERADEPFWSPDSKSIGFFADGQLKIVDTVSGSVRNLARSPVSPGATWSQDGTILVSRGLTLGRISDSGGTIAPLSPPMQGAWPHFLPDGRHFLFYGAHPPQTKPGIYVGSIDSADIKRLMDSDFEATYAAPGYLLFVQQETLMAQPFDPARLELTGSPSPIANGVWVAHGYGHGVFSTAANGALLYVNAAIANTQLSWYDREGRSLGALGSAGRYDSPPQISPDGSTVAIARGPFFQQDVWLLNATHETETRFTFDPAGSRVPVWLRDASQILFQSLRGDGRARIYQKNANGSGGDEIVDNTPGINVQDVSPDGRYVVFMVATNGKFELWLLPRFGDRKPTPFLQTEANNGQAQVSPDGKWIAYTSNESGRDEVFVQSFPTPGSKRQISSDGGAQPRWRRSGGELYYLAPDRTLMAVSVRSETATLQVGRPTQLFRTRLEFLGLQGPYFMPGYDVTADGQRFLLNAPPAQVVPPIDVILNWPSLLNRR